VAGLFDDGDYDMIVAPAEGYSGLYAEAMALRHNKGLVVVQKEDPSSCHTLSETYFSLRGVETVTLQDGTLAANNRVLVVNAVLSGCTMTSAIVQLVQRTGAQVIGVAALASLDYLPRAVFLFPDNLPVRAALHYEEPSKSE